MVSKLCYFVYNITDYMAIK